MRKINEATVKKLLHVVDAGLIKGMGKPLMGQMCVENAVCYTLGLPHSDNPDCVETVVRDFKILLNDANWSSKKARAKGLRKVAVAQLGSKNVVSKFEFARIVTIQTVKRILPAMLMKISTMCGFRQENREFLLSLTKECEAVTTIQEARDTSNHVFNECNRLGYAAAAYAAAAYAAAAAAAAAAYAAYAAANAAANAANAANAAADEILNISADICLQALIELKSPGCKFLYLCN